MGVKHHHLNPALQRALDVLGLHARDDGRYQLGDQVLERDQGLELVKLLGAGISIANTNQARAFVMGLYEADTEHLLRACLWRFRGKADVAILAVRESLSGLLGLELYERLLERALAIHAERTRKGLEP